MLTRGGRAIDHQSLVTTADSHQPPGRPARLVPEEPWLAWMKREWLLVMVTTGVALDWLPWVLTPYAPQFGPLSGTRLLVLPGLALACVLRPSWILRPHVLGVVYLATILIGGGLGWLGGTVERQRLTAIVVNGLILLYYLQLRPIVSIQRVLWITFAFSILVPVVQCFSKLGIISAEMLATRGVVPDPGDTRIFSIFDSTTVGLVPLQIAACLGGLIFVRSPKARSLLTVLLALGLIGLGLTSAAFAQQRSGVLAYAASLAVSLPLYIASQRRRLMWMTKIVLAFGIAALLPAYYAGDLLSGVQARFSDAPAYEGAKELRVSGVATFASDLIENPLELVPKGHQSLLHRTGVEPHLLLSEAYYEGGPLFLAAMIAIVIKFGASSIALARSADERNRMVGICLCGFGCGAAVQVAFQTALALRLVPMMLGIGIAAASAVRVQARSAGIDASQQAKV
jgi:hypothetical protein